MVLYKLTAVFDWMLHFSHLCHQTNYWMWLWLNALCIGWGVKFYHNKPLCFYIFVLICYFSSVDSQWIKTIKLLIFIICLTYFFCCLFGGMITIEGGRLVTSLISWTSLGNKSSTYNTSPVLYLSCNRIYKRCCEIVLLN